MLRIVTASGRVRRSLNLQITKELLVKKLVFVLPLFYSLTAAAGGAQSYALTCVSKSAKIVMNVVHSDPDGFYTSDITLSRAGKKAFEVAELLTDAENSDKAPSRFVFLVDGKLYDLVLSKDAFFAAQDGLAKATLAIDSSKQSATCKGL